MICAYSTNEARERGKIYAMISLILHSNHVSKHNKQLQQTLIDNSSKKARISDNLNEEVEEVEEEQEMIPAASTRRVLTNAQLFGGYIDRYFSK